MAASLDIWALLIIVSLAHSSFVISINLVRKEYHKEEGKWLLLLLLSLFWVQIEFLAIRWPYDVGINLFYGTRHGSWLAIGPLFYFYIQAITKTSVQKRDLLYLLPFALFTFLLPLLLDDFLTFRQIHYGMLTPFDKRPDTINFWQYLYASVFIGQFVYLGYFIFKSKRTVDAYKNELRKSFAELEDGSIKWLSVLWVGMLLIVLFATLFLVILFFTEIYRRHMDYLYVLPISVLVYAISYRLFGIVFQKPLTSSKYQKSGLKSEEAQSLRVQLHELIDREKLYLKNGLRLKDLADELGISTHQLSELLNKHMETTFFDLINRYRVKEAKHRIKTEHQYTLLHIAHSSGFNNKTSFVNAFKRFEGKTPSQYLKNLN